LGRTEEEGTMVFEERSNSERKTEKNSTNQRKSKR